MMRMDDNISIEAVKAVLEERHEEASFINWVDKKKRNKVQKRLLIVGTNRIFSMKPGGKVCILVNSNRQPTINRLLARVIL